MKIRRWVLLSVCLLVLATPAFADLRITLKRTFVEQLKDRATIENVTFTVDHALAEAKSVSSGSKDGDVHISGRSPKIGLPMVAEIINARLEKPSISAVQQAITDHKPIHISGVWRLWAEHGGNTDQKQGAPVRPAGDTNPDHIFEIHPITVLDGTDLAGETFVPITSTTGKSFDYKDAAQAFQAYENVPSHIRFTNTTVTITTRMAGYNYVEFLMQPHEARHAIADGATLMASVLDLDGELLVRNRRMVFVKGSAPFDAVASVTKDSKPLQVIGLPRFDLSLVSWRVRNAKTRPEVLDWSLPYEIVVIAVLNE